MLGQLFASIQFTKLLEEDPFAWGGRTKQSKGEKQVTASPEAVLEELREGRGPGLGSRRRRRPRGCPCLQGWLVTVLCAQSQGRGRGRERERGRERARERERERGRGAQDWPGGSVVLPLGLPLSEC